MRVISNSGALTQKPHALQSFPKQKFPHHYDYRISHSSFHWIKILQRITQCARDTVAHDFHYVRVGCLILTELAPCIFKHFSNAAGYKVMFYQLGCAMLNQYNSRNLSVGLLCLNSGKILKFMYSHPTYRVNFRNDRGHYSKIPE